MVRSARAHTRGRTGDWREVIGALRPITPQLWRALPSAERVRFLRHVRPYWDVHRHRAAPATASAIGRMIEESALHVRAARVVAYRITASDVEVTLRPRGRDETERVVVDRVVNCTGPSSDVTRVGDLLLDSLLASGHIAPDPLRLGLLVDDSLALLDAKGSPHRDVSGGSFAEGALGGTLQPAPFQAVRLGPSRLSGAGKCGHPSGYGGVGPSAASSLLADANASPSSRFLASDPTALVTPSHTLFQQPLALRRVVSAEVRRGARHLAERHVRGATPHVGKVVVLLERQRLNASSYEAAPSPARARPERA